MKRLLQSHGEPVGFVFSGALIESNGAFIHSTKWHFVAQNIAVHFTYVFHPLASVLSSSLRKKPLQITVCDQTLALHEKKQALRLLAQKRL